MPVATLGLSETGTAFVAPARIPRTSSPETKRTTVYAVAFDMDTESLMNNYGSDSYKNAYTDIRKVLEKHGFERKQGSVYFGDPQVVNAVTCVLAVMDLAQTHSWFAPSVRDIRMLRIEEQNDLMDAVQKAVGK